VHNAHMNKLPKPNIFDFTDHRELLKALYEYHHEKDKKFSFRYFSKQAGYSSPSKLKDVIEGRRDVPLKSIQQFMSPFKFTPRQAEYFELLVHFNIEKNSAERRKLFQELAKIQRRPRTREITSKEHTYFDKWYYAAVRALVSFNDFKEDPAWIAKKIYPHITPLQAKEALDILLKLGFISRTKEGKLIQDTPKLEIDPDTAIKSVKNLTHHMIEIEWESIDKFSPEHRQRLGLMLDMSRSCYEDVKKMAQKFQDDIGEYVSKHPGQSEVLCHLGLGLFPLISNEDMDKGVKIG